MQGYGFSVWLLLPERTDQEIRAELGQCGIDPMHRLHLTLVTNLETRQEAQLAAKSFATVMSFEVGGRADVKSKMYQVDPLCAWTVPASIETGERRMTFEPHLSIHYLQEECPPPQVLLSSYQEQGMVAIADTRSTRPEHWAVLDTK